MEEITVRLKERSYKIICGYHTLKKLPDYIKKLRLGNNAVIITNERIKKIIGNNLAKQLSKKNITPKLETIPDSEKSKSQNTAFKLINKISRSTKSKRFFIIALGGGVIGDLSGFVASVYKRGIPYIQIPTTLLAQIDSSIGGKTGIDLDYGKNLVGSFYQPAMVFSDTALLKTLPPREIKSGLSEAVKYGIIKDAALFSYIEKNYKSALKLKGRHVEHIVKKCAKIKAGIVSCDEKETKGVRTVLNFGHTIGHAIEAAGNFSKYNHGEAISLGMLAAVKIAQDLKIFKNIRQAQRIKTLLSNIGLPDKIKGLNLERIIKALAFDKKNTGKHNRFVLPKTIGKVMIKDGIPPQIIRNAITELTA